MRAAGDDRSRQAAVVRKAHAASIARGSANVLVCAALSAIPFFAAIAPLAHTSAGKRDVLRRNIGAQMSE